MILEEPKIRALGRIKTLFPPGSRILEVGFGKGQFLTKLVEFGYKVVGTEISEEMIRKMRDRFSQDPRVQLIYADSPEDVKGHFDCTVCFEVVEHLENPISFLKSFPPNKTFFSTPNSERWWVRLSKGKHEPWDYPPNHMMRYNSDRLELLLSSCGFSPVLVYEMPVKYHELLQPLYSYAAFRLGLKSNTTNYEHVRNNHFGLSEITELVRRASFPVTGPLAWYLNRRGYRGTNLLVETIKCES